MTQHFTKNTVSAEFYCSKCGKFTQHRIDNGRKGPCLNCIERLNQERQADRKAVETQEELFGRNQ